MSEQVSDQKGKNRLIILGNGFDLAHGLKTSYNDFIDWVFLEKVSQHSTINGNLFDFDYTAFDLKNLGITNDVERANFIKENFIVTNTKDRVVTKRTNLLFSSLIEIKKLG